MNVTLVGMKYCAETTLGAGLARRRGCTFERVDGMIDATCVCRAGESLSARKILARWDSGGVTTGTGIVVRIAVKPASSIAAIRQTVEVDGVETTIQTKGRHDPCIFPRIVPVVEAMTALALEDRYEWQAALDA